MLIVDRTAMTSKLNNSHFCQTLPVMVFALFHYVFDNLSCMFISFLFVLSSFVLFPARLFVDYYGWPSVTNPLLLQLGHHSANQMTVTFTSMTHWVDKGSSCWKIFLLLICRVSHWLFDLLFCSWIVIFNVLGLAENCQKIQTETFLWNK